MYNGLKDMLAGIRTSLTWRAVTGLANRSADLSTSATRRDQGKAREAPSSASDVYATLGITREATQTEIREAFYRRAKELHPDVNPSPEAREEFALAQEAFEKLKGKAGVSLTFRPSFIRFIGTVLFIMN